MTATTRWEIEHALRGSGLPAAARLVMHELLSRTDDGGTEIPAKFTPSLTGLASDTGLSRREVAYALNVLESSGWVTRLRDLKAAQAKGQPTRYRPKLPASARRALVHEVHQTASAGGALASAQGAPDLVHEVHPTRPISRPSSSRRTTRTGSKGRAAATDDDDFDSICDKLGATAPQREVIRSLAAAKPRGQFNGYLRAHLDRDGGEEFMNYIRRVTIEEDGAEQAATGQDDDGEEFPF